MKRLITLIVVMLIATACGESQTMDDKKPLSFIDFHCREHAEEYMEFSSDMYDECIELHTKGLIKADSPDEHLSAVH